MDKRETVAAIKAALQRVQPGDDRLETWRQDPRKGVQKLLSQWQHRQEQMAAKKEAFELRFAIERKLWQAGYNQVAGIDEVGRGPLAGPVVCAAVILPHDFDELDVIDSKQLQPKQRERLYDLIMQKALAVSVAFGDPELIDRVNIYQATRQTMLKAVKGLLLPADYLIIDAMDVDTQLPQDSFVKGDAKSNSIAAASIVAKVTRDRYMDEQAQLYPAYQFDHNAGYGTQVHLTALRDLGVTPIHRKTFEPIKSMLGGSQ